MNQTKTPEKFKINGRPIGPDQPVYIVAEMSANHGQNYDKAVAILTAAKEAGADAIKLQTYTADTITLKSNSAPFRIGGGTLWDGRTLHDLYQEAYTPWDWQPKLKKEADKLGLDFFSSPFDSTAVEFLEQMRVPAHKIASFEVVDIPLIQQVAKTGKPTIMSTGMATLEEITEAVNAFYGAGGRQLALLKCTSAYPADPGDMHLNTISDLASRFKTVVGISDHTGGSAVAVAAVALGASIIEKHFILSRSEGGPDSAFSMEPKEFKELVDAVRIAERALGGVHYGGSESEAKARVFRRSLFAVKDIEAGEAFTADNVRSIRPAAGLHTRHLNEVLGKKATRAIEKGTPLDWKLIEK